MQISKELAQQIINRALMDRLSWACLEKRATPCASRDKVYLWKKGIACDLTVYARIVGELSLEHPSITVPPIVKQILTLCLSPNDEPQIVCRRIYDLVCESGYITDDTLQGTWPVSRWWKLGYVATDEQLDYLIALLPSVISQSATSGAGLWIATEESKEVEGAECVHDKANSVTRQEAEELLIDMGRIRDAMVRSWKELIDLENDIGGR